MQDVRPRTLQCLHHNVREARDGQALALHEQLVDDLAMHEALCRHLGLVHVIVIT